MQSIPYGHCHCGCGAVTRIATKTHRQANQVKGEPLLFMLGHNARLQKPNLDLTYHCEDRGYSTPCWIWSRRLNTNGYGQIKVNGHLKLAHRFAYEKLRGSIPDGLEMDHLCRVRCCVNPDHLEPVTKTENARRGKVTKITADEALAIRASPLTGVALSRIYGVTPTQISRIRLRRTWKSI